jgi:pyruvate/2-oxoglutarate dehydrogenase complex dihydrolipoamide dehydrogenase (E3) component
MITGQEPLNYPGASDDAVWRDLTFPADYKNPVSAASYHLVVIGAGSAGLITAIGAAGLGARVALIEREAMGGDCLNIGCVPSKALLEYTRQAGEHANFDEAFAWLRKVRAKIAEHDSVSRYNKNGVDVYLGSAQLLSDRVVQVGDQTLRARRIVIATGARAALPPVPGLAECEPLTNATLFDLTVQPESIAILGGGAIGCEMAQAFSRLGTAVELFELQGRVLPLEMEDASAAVAAALERDGVNLHLGEAVASISQHGGKTIVETSGTQVTVDRILVAAGRQANVEGLQLDSAGVKTESGLIKVDRRLRTTNPRIYAAGDVCSREQFTHNADAQARIVIQNALFAPTANTDSLIIPHCTYTDPEVAQIGKSRTLLEESSTAFDTYRVAFNDIDRGRVTGDSDGFVEVLTRAGNDVILGATIVGHDAGEQIAPLCVAMSQRLGLSGVGSAILPYPTRAEYLRRLADSYNRTRLTPLAQRIMSIWFRLSSG